MTHRYPSGAIQDEKDLFLNLLGQPLFCVHGLGKQSWITEMLNVRNLHTNNAGYREVEYDYFSDYSDEYTQTSLCLGDMNIGCHHNDHYLFRKKEDAEAYLKWAKEHTAPPGRNHIDRDQWYLF